MGFFIWSYSEHVKRVSHEQQKHQAVWSLEGTWYEWYVHNQMVWRRSYQEHHGGIIMNGNATAPVRRRRKQHRCLSPSSPQRRLSVGHRLSALVDFTTTAITSCSSSSSSDPPPPPPPPSSPARPHSTIR